MSPPTDLATRRAPITAVDTSTRTITARLVTWNDERQVQDPDGLRYRETFAPGSLEPLERTYVLDEHGGELIGRMDNHRDDGTGHVADLTIADTTTGRDLLALVDAGVIDAVSIEFDQRGGDASWSAERDAVTRTRAALHGVAFAFHPAHTAPILAVRQESAPVNDTPLPTPTVTVTPASADDLENLRGEVVGIRDELAARASAGVHPAARWSSPADLIEAAFDGDPVAKRALTDQLTTNNPGVIPPGWLQDVKGIVTFGRPGITAVGTAPLPDAGMDINWPYFAGTLTALVGVQATQKTTITTVAVNLLKGSESILTFAGGSDISYQLIRRSSPSYKEAYLRIMTAAYAAVTDQHFVADLVASAGDTIDLAPGSATAATFRAALFQASMQIFIATGQPATAVLADSVWFGALGALADLWPQAYGTQNTAGTAQASTLTVNVSGLPVTYDPYLAAGQMVVTNGMAARWHEDGPFVVTAEDVEKLGQNVAVWGMGATAAYIPAGIIVIADVA